MVKFIAFEGSDFVGKTATLAYLKNDLFTGAIFNKGPLYPTRFAKQIMSRADCLPDTERELLYATIYISDVVESALTRDNNLVFQDRYWSSTIACSRFFNKEKSLYNCKDFRPLFLQPIATIFLTCSTEERIKRSSIRNDKSSLDSFLLDDPRRFEQLDVEFRRSFDQLPNVYEIDTTNKSVQTVAEEIKSLNVHNL